MALPPLQARHYQVEVLTEHFFFAAALEPFGMLMTYLNNPERPTIRLKQVTASALDTSSTVNTFQADELWAHRDEILAIRLLESVSTGTVPLLPHKEKLRVFLHRFAVQAVFHRGADVHISDIFEAMSGFWAAATEAKVYPLLPTRASVFHDAQLLLLNKRHIRLYQAVTN